MTTTSPTTSSYETYTKPILQFSETWDYVIATISIACFIIGTIGNILALIYFANKRKDLPTKIYILMTITDALSCFLVIVVAMSFINERQASLFQYNWLCDIWSTVWNVTPYFSVFLVLILSVVRTISLINPFRSVKHKVVLAIIFFYLFYLIARIIIPQVMKKSYNAYDKRGLQHIYCGINLHKVDGLYYYQITSNVVQLTAPVFPIIVSCVISCYCVLKSRKANALSRKTVSQKPLVIPKTGTSHQTSVDSESSLGAKGQGPWNKMLKTARTLSAVSVTPLSGPGKVSRNPSNVSSTSGKDRQKQATITILLITGMYIVFNIPVFIYYIFFVVEVFIVRDQSKLIFLNNNHVNYYGWNLVFVQCVALNAALNPVVYCWRIEKMRHFYAPHRIKNWLRNAGDDVQICLGLKEKHQRKLHTSFSVTHTRTYVEVIDEEAV